MTRYGSVTIIINSYSSIKYSVVWVELYLIYNDWYGDKVISRSKVGNTLFIK